MSKFFLGPMSKNIVDAILESEKDFILIPSRRQVEYSGGYVNNWKTSDFAKYVNGRVKIQRDHGGPLQGIVKDKGKKSFGEDLKYFDLIHVDPWKAYADIDTGVKKTVEAIKFIHRKNKNIEFEVCTEEAIRSFTCLEINYILDSLHRDLTKKEFEKITFVSIQSGVGLDLFNQKNTGSFDEDKLARMIKIVKSFGKKSKEHNGDFLCEKEYEKRFSLGLDAINIAPELGLIETDCYLKYFKETSSEILMEKMYEICKKSGRWKKWVTKDFDLKEREKLIMVCGHYIFSNKEFMSLKPDIDDTIKKTIKKRLDVFDNIQRNFKNNE